MMDSIPFSVMYYDKEYNHYTAKGIMIFEKDVLSIEVRSYGYMGEAVSGISTCKIPIDQMRDIRFKNRFFYGLVTLETKSLKLLEDMPGSSHGVVKCSVERKHRRTAAQFCSKVGLRLSEFRLENME